MPDRTIVCRCEDLSLKDVRELIDQGFQSIDEIKRISRCGMGPCQGRGCRQVVAQEIAAATGKKLDEIEMPKFRPPVKPVKLGILLGGEKEDA
jgi:BFD-like [2Fe-2S] binding domain.